MALNLLQCPAGKLCNHDSKEHVLGLNLEKSSFLAMVKNLKDLASTMSQLTPLSSLSA